MSAAQSLDLDQLRARARAVWTTAVDVGAVAAAAAASAELAGRAYQEHDREARWRAESILYYLNLDTFFAPPIEPVAAITWVTLMQVKLAAARRELGPDPAAGDMGEREMEEILHDAVGRWGAFRHPLLDDLEQRGGLDAYRVWAKNWFGSCQGFSLQLASLFQRTAGAAKKAVLENLSDEQDHDTTHDDLRLRFYQSLGLRHSPEHVLDDPDWVLESTELLNIRTGLCSLADPRPALGCFYGVEANWPPECQRHHAMNRARGLDDHTIEYWTTHAFVDQHHAAEWLESVKAVCATPAERAAVVEGAVIQLRLRWRMYDAIRARVAALA